MNKGGSENRNSRNPQNPLKYSFYTTCLKSVTSAYMIKVASSLNFSILVECSVL